MEYVAEMKDILWGFISNRKNYAANILSRDQEVVISIIKRRKICRIKNTDKKLFISNLRRFLQSQ